MRCSSCRIERRKASASSPAAALVSAPMSALPATMTYVAPASRSARHQVGAPCLVRLVVADQADDRGLARLVVRREDVVDALGRPGDDGVDAAGGEQVGGERAARGVGGDSAHRREEHRRRSAVVAQRLVLAGIPVHVDRVTVRAALRQLLVEVGELRDAGDRALALGDVERAGRDGLGDGFAEEVERLDEPAPALDLAEQRPGGAGEVVRELLDGVRATSRVGDRGDVRLADQEARGVAGDAAAERLRQAERLVERQHRDGGRSPDAGRERGDGRAEHVHVRVVLRHHRAGGHGVLQPDRRRRS